MIAFFAATPLQMFNCMNIRLSEFAGEPADLFLLSFAADLSGLYEAAKAHTMFDNVYYLSEPFNRRGRWRFMKSFALPDRKTLACLTRNHYEAMFSTRIGTANDFYYTVLSRKNPSLSFHYYEEGIGDYIVPIERPVTTMVKLIGYMCYKNPFRSVRQQWLYRPEYRLANKQYDAKTIQRPDHNPECISAIRRVFSLPEARYLPQDCRIVYFDQAFRRQTGIPFDDLLILEKLSEIVPKGNIYVKLHPVNQQDVYAQAGYKTLARLNVPWEVLLLGEDLSRVVFAAVHSTAVTTPKTMFGLEPPALLLYPCFPSVNEAGERLHAYFDKVRQTYTNPERFQIVSELETLPSAVKALGTGIF